MSKVKYYYDTKTLSYRKIEKTFNQKVKDSVVVIAASAILAAMFFALYVAIIDSPKEKQLKRENMALELQYKLLNERMDKMAIVLNDMQNRDDNIYRVIFESDPIPSSVRKAGFGGVNRYKELEGYASSDLLVETQKKLDILSKMAAVQSKSFDDVKTLALDKEKMLASIPGIQPIANKDLKRMASGYGRRIHPIYKVRKMHWGMDFSAKTGTPIFATGDGKISNDRKIGGSGYGKYVVIDHGYGYQTLYAHMSKVSVKKGQKVKRGDIIGYVGNTGRSVAPHLHYEVVKDGKKINPINFYYSDLTPEEFEQMIEISNSINQSFD
ncbi:MAG: M23 family metallopeptidase [Schleiferiaceae bacterium]|jgi:murein DD-endopeptidase MepM/ murein hydrolase activator NlpD|nr:M23 family metallopeptidase [Schleiferiaceae bacterium]